MFSVWPELFAFELLAVFLLRVVAGYFFLLMGMRLLRATYAAKGQRGLLRSIGALYGGAQFLVGGFLFAGFLTQPAALGGVLLTLLPVSNTQSSSKCEQHVQLLLFTISMSLLFLGPGVFAFDLPL